MNGVLNECLNDELYAKFVTRGGEAGSEICFDLEFFGIDLEGKGSENLLSESRDIVRSFLVIVIALFGL
jgi:hypothetical protein